MHVFVGGVGTTNCGGRQVRRMVAGEFGRRQVGGTPHLLAVAATPFFPPLLAHLLIPSPFFPHFIPLPPPLLPLKSILPNGTSSKPLRRRQILPDTVKSPFSALQGRHPKNRCLFRVKPREKVMKDPEAVGRQTEGERREERERRGGGRRHFSHFSTEKRNKCFLGRRVGVNFGIFRDGKMLRWKMEEGRGEERQTTSDGGWGGVDCAGPVWGLD